MSIPPFTIVVPMKDEIKRLERTLPAFYKVKPDEVIICTDDPIPLGITETVNRIAVNHGMENNTKILNVSRNPEYSYHQAWVRRSGFRAARNDIILTSDIDLVINKNVLKAIKLVGKNNIGMVTLSKFRHPYDVTSYFRAFGLMCLRLLYFLLLRHVKGSGGLKMTTFTGLYVIYRPYWLEMEDESVKQMAPPIPKRNKYDKYHFDDFNMGEDTFLRDCIEKKYDVIYLSRLGGVIIDREKHYHKSTQFQRGRYSAKRQRSLLGAIVHTILHLEPGYFRGFLSERRRKDVFTSES
ncbi:MAG: glycosyltransferase [Candidatus Hodarchaeales archaeon]